MNPFISIWTQPKKTLAYLIEHKTISYGLMIMVISSLCSGVMAFADTGLLAGFSLPSILAISFGISLLISIPAYFICALVYTWIGKLLGGTGNWREMCLVIAGGMLPMILTLPIGILAIAIYGKDLFVEPVGVFAVTNMSLVFYLLYTVIMMGLSIFSTVIQSKGIGLVHNFSAWRGFGTIMIFAGVVFVLSFILIIALISGLLFVG